MSGAVKPRFTLFPDESGSLDSLSLMQSPQFSENVDPAIEREPRRTAASVRNISANPARIASIGVTFFVAALLKSRHAIRHKGKLSLALHPA